MMTTTNSLIIPTERYQFQIEADNLTIPRLGVGANAIVLDSIDVKSGVGIAIKFVQLHRGSTLSELESKERFFDREVEKSKALANDPFLLEYLDDCLLSHDDLVLLKTAPGIKAYQLSFIKADELSDQAQQALTALNQHIDHRAINDLTDTEWTNQLYQRRTALRETVSTQMQQAQVLNGQRFLIAKKYQTTLTRLLVQQPNLTTEERLELLLELIKALKQIHNMGITHGDLCPDNIMFKLSMHKDKKLAQELRREGISSRYLYELQTRLIDLGRVVKSDMKGLQRVTVGLPIRDANNRLPYAPKEMVSMAERMPFERYKISYRDNQLILEPLWEFEALSEEDELLGQLTLPEQGRGGTATEGMSRGRRLGQMFTQGDILYNSTWGFVVEQTQEEKVIISSDDIYQLDHKNYTLQKVSKEAFIGDGSQDQWEFDDILYANYQLGIPADIFAIGMVITETIAGSKLEPGALRSFAERCKSMEVDGRTSDQISEDIELKQMADVFKELDLRDLFTIILRCVIRGEPSLGYYCVNHADDSSLATIKLLKDFTELAQRYLAYKTTDSMDEQLKQLTDQLDHYKNVVGPDSDRSVIFRNMAKAQLQIEDLETTNQQQQTEIAQLTENLANLTTEQQQLQQQHQALSQEKTDLTAKVEALEAKKAELEKDKADLQEDKANLQQDKQNLENDIANQKRQLEALKQSSADELEAKQTQITELNNELTDKQNQINDLQTQINDLKAQLESSKSNEFNLNTKLDIMRERLKDLSNQYGTDFLSVVKGWGSRKEVAAILQEFADTLSNDAK